MENDFNKGVRQYLIRSIIAPILMGAVFFIVAGDLTFLRGWTLYGLYFILSLITNVILYYKNPELLYHRTKKRKEGVKKWDKWLMPVAIITGAHFQALAMGFDVKLGLTHLGYTSFWIGIIIYLFSFVIGAWSMVVNKYFETNVRIQNDRNHQVISDGPYQFVRHPGYIGFIIGCFGASLIIGSLIGLVVALISSILIVIRTKLEDDTLQHELKGYQSYSNVVRSRLFPGIW